MSSPPPRTPTVLITGAAKRLGREIALHLAAHGWRVAIHYRDSLEDAAKTVADCSRLTGGAAAFRANLSNETAVRQLVPTVVESFGYLDAVVNSASTSEHDRAQDFSFASMDKHMRSNAGAAILLSTDLHRHVCDTQRRGVVVNLLDQKLWMPRPEFISYTLSKAALQASSSMLALALAPAVRVVGIAPGPTLTNPVHQETAMQALHHPLPHGYSCTPQEVAATVLQALHDPDITHTTLLVGGTTEIGDGAGATLRAMGAMGLNP